MISGKTCGLEACHILPHAANANTPALRYQKNVWGVVDCMFDGAISREIRELVTEKEGSMDQHWNMLILNTYLHDLFDRGCFGLEPLDYQLNPQIRTYVLRIRFHWYYKADRLINKAPVPTFKASKNAYKMAEDQGKFRQAVEINVTNGRYIDTGYVFTIQLDEEISARKMFLSLKLRWAVGNILFLAGGAGLNLNKKDSEPDEDDSYAFRMKAIERDYLRSGPYQEYDELLSHEQKLSSQEDEDDIETNMPGPGKQEHDSTTPPLGPITEEKDQKEDSQPLSNKE